jgi:hypothetical protein
VVLPPASISQATPVSQAISTIVVAINAPAKPLVPDSLGPSASNPSNTTSTTTTSIPNDASNPSSGDEKTVGKKESGAKEDTIGTLKDDIRKKTFCN